MSWHPSLRLRLFLALLAFSAMALALHAAARYALHLPEPWAALATWGAALPLAWLAARKLLAPLQQLLTALDTVVLSWRDGDLATHLASPGHAPAELNQLLAAHTALHQAIRDERQQLAQGELMLNSLVQHTPLALVLLDADERVRVANLAARALLNEGRSLIDRHWPQVLATAPEGLARVLRQGRDGLFPLQGVGADEEQWFISQRPLSLQGQPFTLLLLRPLTQELARQEVASWKRVIRVLSHELNNSLAPISSLAHSGAELSRQALQPALEQVFDRVGERAAHLHAFLSSYAQFARLPTPRLAPIDWPALVQRLAAHQRLTVDGPLPEQAAQADTAQLEQALLNLLKNAHESGSPPEAVTLRASVAAGQCSISVADRGVGLSDAGLAQALLPFYSTKRGGTGLGLALAREIAEAHGGRLSLARRRSGGLRVTLVWPV